MPMLLKTVEQSPTELVLAILQNELPADLRILREAQVKQGDWCVHFRIIGESHAITLTHHNRVCFHEVLACINISPEDCTHYQPFQSLNTHHYMHSPMPYAAYEVLVNFDNTPAYETPRSTDSMIEFAFPNDGQCVPITRIHWRITDEQLTWWTLHTYPQSGTVTYVHSHSQVTFTR